MSKKIPVQMSNLIRNHPTSDSINATHNKMIQKLAKRIRREVETCAIRLSYALNETNQQILNAEKYIDKRRIGSKTGAVRTITDSLGKSYIYSTYDFAAYLDQKYFKLTRYRGTTRQIKSKLNGKNGIIGFGYRHVDLWQQDRWHYQNRYYDLWECASAKQSGILFWETL